MGTCWLLSRQGKRPARGRSDQPAVTGGLPGTRRPCGAGAVAGALFHVALISKGFQAAFGPATGVPKLVPRRSAPQAAFRASPLAPRRPGLPAADDDVV